MTEGIASPGWYEDTTRPDALRYWNGKRWTMKWKDMPLAEGPYFVIGEAAYLGGHPHYPAERAGRLLVTTDRVALGADVVVIDLATVETVEITSEQIAKSRVGPVVLFGVLGLGAKGSRDRTTIVQRGKDGSEAFFQLLGVDAPYVRAQLTPVLAAAGVPFHDAALRSRVAPTSVADEISKLADLMRQGLLTEEEFAAQKAKLLE
jgi:Short C-terminal domain/Protein of unknown function (DUF2510)